MNVRAMFPGVTHWRGRHLVICNWRDGRHPQAGGAELYCEQTARQLSQAGLRVTYLTARFPGAPRHEKTPYGTVVRRGGRYSVYFFALLWLLRHRRRIDAVIDSQNGLPFFSPLALPRRTPVVLLVHHVHQQQFAQWFPRPVATLGRWLENQGSTLAYGRRAVCAVSPSSRAQIRAQLGLRGPVHLAPPGLVSSPREGWPGRARARTPRIVCVGRLARQKRWERLIGALPAVRRACADLEVHVVGDGEARSGLEELAGSLGIGAAVIFHGRLPDGERDALLATAWLTVTTASREGWGLSVMEAAAAGVPAVAYDVPGLRDTVLDDRTGWLLRPDEDLSAALTLALRELRSPVRASSWDDRCRAWAASFTWSATAAHLLAALSDERQRLRTTRPEERRAPASDLSSLVVLPFSLLIRADLTVLRAVDLIDAAAPRARLLLPGADEQDARTVLARMGVDLTDRRVCIRLARHHDTLGWRLHPPCHSPAVGLPARAT